MSNLFGTGINQVPTNGMLGNLAFQDKAYVAVDAIGIGTTFVDSGTVGQVLQVSGGAYVSGNLGVGVTNPQSTLHVLNSDITKDTVIQIHNDPNSNLDIGLSTTYRPRSVIAFSENLITDHKAHSVIWYGNRPDSDNFSDNNNSTIIGNLQRNNTSAATGGVWFAVRDLNDITTGGLLDLNSTDGSEYAKLSIQAGLSAQGNFGIGTDFPEQKLHVVGNALITGITTLGITTATNLTSQNLNVSGVSTFTDIRIASSSEKTTLVSGNTVSLVYNTGGGNVAICTNPTGPITLNVTGIPTDSTFNNRMLTFSVVAIQTSIGYACTAITLNGVSRTIRYPGAVVSTPSTSSYDIFNLTGINTVGSASTTANYQVLGIVNGNFK